MLLRFGLFPYRRGVFRLRELPQKVELEGPFLEEQLLEQHQLLAAQLDLGLRRAGAIIGQGNVRGNGRAF